MAVVQLCILRTGLSEAVNHCVQKWIDETNLNARRFSAEHGKALLRVFADFDGGRSFLPLSWLSHALHAFHAVNAIGQHLSLFLVVAKQIIVPVVDKQPVWADNVVWLNIYLDDEKIGDMGLVAKKVSMECGIKNLSVILFEMDASKLKPLKSRTNKFEHLAEYPETDYDISMLFDSDAVWNDIYDAVMGKKKASALLKDASFVDEYRGKQIPQGKKSVTIRLTIGSDEKTLTSQEIESVAEQVMKKLGKKMGAELRTQ